MELSKNELHVLKYIRIYKLISLGCMIFGIQGILSGLYNYFTSQKPYYGVYLNNQLMGISLAVIGMGYLMYSFVKIIEKFQFNMNKNNSDKSC